VQGHVVDAVKMTKHGEIETSILGTSYSCQTHNFPKEAGPISLVMIYYTPSTITKLMVATADQQAYTLGSSSGSKNSGFLRFDVEGQESNSFFGFTS